MDGKILESLRALRADERGPGARIKDAPLHFALVYPSPYAVAMSSLGFLQIHRLANERPGTVAERATLPEPASWARHLETRTPLLTLESQRSVADFHLIGISHAYELELAGVARVLTLAGLKPLAQDRGAYDPLVVIGGPITFSNPLPTAPFADVMILGEAEALLGQLLDRLERAPEAAKGDPRARAALLDELAGMPGFFIPSRHGEYLPPIAQAPDVLLPARSEIRTPHTELHDMVLIEPERGCHRGCTFCVMRRSTNGGMRLVEPEVVVGHIPADAPRVGLVGAAVSDHPRIKLLLKMLVEQGKQIGISSLRADRLDDEFVSLLHQGGYRSLTVALDAPSVRLREAIEKNLRDRHVLKAAELARSHKMRHLKLYVIVGLPGETAEDREELIQFCLQLRRTIPLVLGVSPFVPKFHTPLADAPFVGEAEADEALKQLKRGLSGKVEVRGPGAREAYIEYRLAQGGFMHAAAAVAAAADGGNLGAWRRALRDLPERSRPSNFASLIPAPTRRRLAMASQV